MIIAITSKSFHFEQNQQHGSKPRKRLPIQISRNKLFEILHFCSKGLKLDYFIRRHKIISIRHVSDLRSRPNYIFRYSTQLKMSGKLKL